MILWLTNGFYKERTFAFTMQYDQNVNQLEKLKAMEGISCSVMHFVSVLAELGLELFLSFLLGYSDTLGDGTGQQLF